MKCPCCNAALEVIDAELVEVPACELVDCYNRQDYLIYYDDFNTIKCCKKHSVDILSNDDRVQSIRKL